MKLTKDDIEISVISYTKIDREIKIKKVHSEVGRSRMDKAHGKSCTKNQDYFSMVYQKVKEVIMKKLILNTTKNLILILTVLFLLWILISWFDIVAHNDPWRSSHEYMPGNAFSVLVHEYD